MVHKKKTFKDIIITIVKYLMVVGAFAYLIGTGKLNFSDIKNSLSHPGYVFLGVVFTLIPMLVSFVRYNYLLKALDINLGLSEVCRLGFIGCFFNTFMLGGMGGDVVKVAYIMRDTGKRAPVIASAMVDRVLGLTGMIFIGGLIMLYALEEILATPSLHKLMVAIFTVICIMILCGVTSIITLLRSRRWGFAIWILMLAGGIVSAYFLINGAEFNPIKSPGEVVSDEILLKSRIFLAMVAGLICSFVCILIMPSLLPGRTLEKFVSAKVPLGKNLMSFISSLLEYHNSLPTLTAGMFLSFITHGTNMTALYFFSQAIDLEQAPKFVDIFFAAPIAFVANALPVPGGGMGVGEVVFNNLLEMCRSASGQPIIGGASIFVLWRVWFVVLGLIGLPLYIRGKKKILEAEEAYEELCEG